MAQRTAIAATEAQWAGSSMVVNKFLWTWDARPYPYWPDLLDVWSDGDNWVHRPIGCRVSSGPAMSRPLSNRSQRVQGLALRKIDTSNLQMLLDGFIINDRVTARAALQQLMQAYFFTIKEHTNSLVCYPAGCERGSHHQRFLTVLRKKAGNLMVPYVLTRQEDLMLPQRQEVHFLNRLQRYETNVESAERSTKDANDVVAAKFQPGAGRKPCAHNRRNIAG